MLKRTVTIYFSVFPLIYILILFGITNYFDLIKYCIGICVIFIASMIFYFVLPRLDYLDSSIKISRMEININEKGDD